MDAALLSVLERSQRLGFLGPGPVRDHVVHARQVVPWFERHLPSPGSDPEAVDLGSGGGVPGLVLATALPQWRWMLLDSLERRTEFLTEAVATLGLAGRVVVRRARAEEVGREPAWRERFDAVVARSFGPAAVTAECGSPLVRDGGALLVSEPPEPAPERWPADRVSLLGLEVGNTVGSWRVLTKRSSTPDRFPRPVGRPGKRPLW